MADKALVIPASFRVGSQFPDHLPLADGSLKPLSECSRAEVAEAVDELKSAAMRSRERLDEAYADHIQDIEMLARISAYLTRFEQWRALREGGTVRETLWHLQEDDHGR